jgi:endoglucanase
MKINLILCAAILCAATVTSVQVSGAGSGPVSKYGQLKIIKGQLCDRTGKPVQLIGVSSTGLQWFPFEKDTVKNLVRDWKISVIRAAMYTDENGYIANSAMMKERLTLIVDTAIENDIYVIIDWHVLRDKDPNKYKDQSVAFFKEMAKTYGKKPHIIYEICNEPNGSEVTWLEQVTPYAKTLVTAIRSIDPDNIIIVGTDTFCQGVQIAAELPLKGTNIAYALHFYAGSHGSTLREAAEEAIDKGLPLFVSECGLTDAQGITGTNLEEAKLWFDWMDEKKISWIVWSFSSRGNEESSMLKGETNINGPWSDDNLSPNGKWVKDRIAKSSGN